MTPRLVLGADFSTDSLKFIVLDAASMTKVTEGSFNFVTEFGEAYGLTLGGFHDRGGGEVRIPYGLFPDAIDLMFRRTCAFLGSDVRWLRRVIVSLQQHGMVAWKHGSEGRLLELGKDPQGRLSQGINALFATDAATSWRDTSSHDACVQLEQFLPANRWAELTGSSPLQAERFLGAQIDRLARESKQTFRDTECFTVLASFVASLLTGYRVPIGLDEASCTLLMNLKRGQWSKTLRELFPSGTFTRLPKIVEPCRQAGALWSYHVQRHKLPVNCSVSLGMGDNVAAQVTTADAPGQMSISGGSSGTVYQELPKATFDATHACHVLRTATRGFMGMFCTPHCGKLADEVRGSVGMSWEEFDRAVSNPQWDDPADAVFVGADGLRFMREPSKASGAAITRSIIMHMKRRCAFMGRPTSLVATGGFLTKAVAQVVADIFGCTVYQQPKMNRVAWGSVVMAVAQELQAPVPDVVRALCPTGTAINPTPASASFYQKFAERFEANFPR